MFSIPWWHITRNYTKQNYQQAGKNYIFLIVKSREEPVFFQETGQASVYDESTGQCYRNTSGEKIGN